MLKGFLLIISIITSFASISQVEDARARYVNKQADILSLISTTKNVEDSIRNEIKRLDIIAKNSGSNVMKKLIPAISALQNDKTISSLKTSYGLLYSQNELSVYDSIAIYQLIASVYRNLGETEMSKRNIKEATRMRDMAGLDPNTLSGWLMSIYYYSGEMETGIEEAKKNIDRENPAKSFISISNIGTTYSDLGEFDSSMYYLNWAKSIKGNSLTREDNLYLNLGYGNNYYTISNIDSALHYYKKVISDTSKLENWYPYTMANHSIATIYLESGKQDSCKRYLNQFFLCPCLGNETNAWLHMEKAKFYKTLGDESMYFKELEKAHEYQEKHVDELREDIRSISDLNSSSILLIEENLKVKEENNKAYLQMNKAFTALIIVLVALMVTLIFFFAFRTKKKKQLFEVQKNLDKAKINQVELERQKLELKVQNKNLDLNQMASSISMKKEILNIQRGKLSEILKENDDEMKIKLKHHIRELSNLLNIDDNVDTLQSEIETINNEFINRITEEHPDLTKNDIEICTLHLLGLSSKGIASMRGVSPKAIQIARYRIKKKMNLTENQDFLENLKKYAT